MPNNEAHACTGLTSDGCLARRRQLWQALPEQTQWILVADPRHVQYLANFWIEPLSFSCGERALLLLERDAQATLLGDNFVLRRAFDEPCVDETLVAAWYDHRRSVENRDLVLAAAVEQIASRLRGRAGIVEAEWLPLTFWRVLPTDDVLSDGPDLGSLLRQMRRRKAPDEIALLNRCMRATEAGHRAAREFVRIGVSELDLYRQIQSAAVAAAEQPPLVYGDFRANNGAAPKVGGLPTAYCLQQGDLVILDYSVVLGGYRSDFTNTLAAGEPTEQQVRLASACAAALAAGETRLRPGVAACDVYAAASGALTDAGYSAIPHHAGHGLGLAHPEPPILGPESEDVLEAGDVVTLEPGQYVEGVGGVRIEHNYLITDDGFERLSQHELGLGGALTTGP